MALQNFIWLWAYEDWTAWISSSITGNRLLWHKRCLCECSKTHCKGTTGEYRQIFVAKKRLSWTYLLIAGTQGHSELRDGCLDIPKPQSIYCCHHPFLHSQRSLKILGLVTRWASYLERIQSTHQICTRSSQSPVIMHLTMTLSGDTLQILFASWSPTIASPLPLQPPFRLLTSLHTDKFILKPHCDLTY